jgi:hypothetical protein
MSVKAYAELVDKSDKTIYKQIKKGSLGSVRVKKGYRVSVDTNMLKRIKRLEIALEEAKTQLKYMEKETREAAKKKTAASAAPEKNRVKGADKPEKASKKRS